ncbi:hypothetical protein EGW08_011734 [Elysia chlorotica]|uniref:Ig-like domain-containing protein n=1 Tax=Elysia chlorotica TaxID=188477 RepID=A0A3S0ZQN6_ELYCH|nr:hypothetical protein EGW08_011734 [Elysia chlorotica]
MDLFVVENKFSLSKDQQHHIRLDKTPLAESTSKSEIRLNRKNTATFLSNMTTTGNNNPIKSIWKRPKKYQLQKQFISNIYNNDSQRNHFENRTKNVTALSRELVSEKKKRSSKEKRFLSNLKSSLKKHLENRHGTWAISSKEAEKLFQTYYQCITDRMELLKAEEFPIKAFMAVEGEKVMMECKVCSQYNYFSSCHRTHTFLSFRPDVDAASQRAVWQILGHEATEAHAVTPSKKIKILKDNTLVIKDIDVADAGQYYCVEHRDYMAIYQLDVFLTDKRRHAVLARKRLYPSRHITHVTGPAIFAGSNHRPIPLWDDRFLLVIHGRQYYCVEHRDYMAIYQLDVFLTDKRRHVRVGKDQPRDEEYLFDRNLRVYTTWAAWSECNTCDRPGRRIRVGQCTVKKIYVDLPVFPRDYPLMVLYPEGMPCHSTALPSHIRRLHHISQRHSETIVLPCMEACPTAPPTRVVTDKNGEVLEILEPGFYPIKDKPSLPPIVKRKVFYEPEKSHLVLKCPGNLERPLVHWARGERTVDPSHVKRQTKGRVWLDTKVRLHFSPLLLSDTAVYK